MITESDWIDFFPFEKVRPEQAIAINFTLNQFINEKKKFVLGELGVGIGKSAIAVTVSRFLDSLQGGGAYVLTTQKILQAQYLKDFAKIGLRSLKSADNYMCDTGMTCAVTRRVARACMRAPECAATCPYSADKKAFLESPLGVTNYAYFMNETTYAGKLEPRNLLILDECLRPETKIWVDGDQEVCVHEIWQNPNITHVMSYNSTDDKYERKRIIRKIRTSYNKTTKWIKIKVSHACLESSITVTANHKIWTKTRGYIRADDLLKDDVLKYDVLEKENATRSYMQRRVEKSFPELNVSCLCCRHSFASEKALNYHLGRTIEYRACPTCSCRIRITLSSIDQRFCSKECFSTSEEASEKRSQRMLINNPMNDEKCVEKMKASIKANWDAKSPEEKRKIIENWTSAPRHEKRNKPNSLEQFVIDLDLPKVMFTGLGSKWVTFKNGKHKNPDFVVEGTNKVIEVGDVYFWHTEEEIRDVVEQYEAIGYECLYVTNKQLEADEEYCRLQLQKFATNHDVVVEKISFVETVRNWDDKKEHFKYNLEVEDNHNYFANSILVSNCHTTEGVLTKFASVDISDQINRSVLGKTRIRIPFESSQEEAFEWISDPYRKALANGKLKLQREIAKGKLGDNAERYSRIDKHLCRVNRFVERYKPEDWIYCMEDGRSGKVMSFKPIRVDSVSHETLFERGKYVLMLSASILDKDTFCKWIGLKPEEVAYMNIDCPFPIENRPVHFLPVGKMNRAEIDSTLPKMVEIVKGLLELHKGEKGIIHATSHKVARFIKEQVKDPRLLYRDDGDRDEMIREHATRKDASVMLSPSMTEGVDLVDDLSRFQIFVKVPFPNMGDAVIAKRMQLDSKWYALETTRTMVQGVGRSIRNMEDRATTYVLDESFAYFYEKNKDMFPESFRKSLKS